MLKLLVCGDTMYRSNAMLYLNTFVSCPVYPSHRVSDLFGEFSKTLDVNASLTSERILYLMKEFFREEIEGASEFEPDDHPSEVCIIACSCDYKMLSNMNLDKSHIIVRVVSKSDARCGHIFLPGDIGDDVITLPSMFLAGDDCPSILISVKKLIASLKSAKYFDYYADTDILVNLFGECTKSKRH